MRNALATTVGALVLLTGCGGGDDGRSADEVVRQWAEAVNARDWAKACELSSESSRRCEKTLRTTFDGDTLTFEGPATDGGGTKPGDSYFSLRRESGGTAFVTAVRRDDGFVVRLEAVVQS